MTMIRDTTTTTRGILLKFFLNTLKIEGWNSYFMLTNLIFAKAGRKVEAEDVEEVFQTNLTKEITTIKDKLKTDFAREVQGLEVIKFKHNMDYNTVKDIDCPRKFQ